MTLVVPVSPKTVFSEIPECAKIVVLGPYDGVYLIYFGIALAARSPGGALYVIQCLLPQLKVTGKNPAMRGLFSFLPGGKLIV